MGQTIYVLVPNLVQDFVHQAYVAIYGWWLLSLHLSFQPLWFSTSFLKLVSMATSTRTGLLLLSGKSSGAPPWDAEIQKVEGIEVNQFDWGMGGPPLVL